MNPYETESDYDGRLAMYAEVVEEEYDPGDDLYRVIDDTLDGMVRNYTEALHVLLHSETQPDDWDVYLDDDAMADSIEGHLVNLAYMTLRADLKRTLRDRDNGIDP